MQPTSTQKVIANGLNFQLAKWEGAGNNVLGIHGLTANCRCFDAIAPAICPKNNLMAMDLRGRGLSDKPAEGYSIPQHCQDIKQIVSQLDLSPLVLMGHSLGAAIALKFASQNPQLVQKVILIDGGGALSEEQMDKVKEGIKPSLQRLGKTYANFQEYITPLKNSSALQPWNENLENYFRYETVSVAEGVKSRIQPENIQEELENLAQTDIQECYAQINSPVLILRATWGMLGKDDLVLPREASQKMLHTIPRAKVVDIPDSNHYTIIFHPSRERDRAISSFLGDSKP